MLRRYRYLFLIVLSFWIVLCYQTSSFADSQTLEEEAVIDALSITYSSDVIASQVAIQSKLEEKKEASIFFKNITSSKVGDYRNAIEAQNPSVMYRGFQPLAHGIAITYNNPTLNANEPAFLAYNGQKEVIQLIYDNVGIYKSVGDKGQIAQQPFGVCLTLSNIIVSSSPKWTKDQLQHPWIECSNSFTDGIVFGNIQKMDAEYAFFDSDSGKVLNFPSLSDAVLTFSSLNAYPNASLVGDTKKQGRHEFVGATDQNKLSTASLFPDSLLAYHPSSSEKTVDEQSFYSDKAIEGIDFTDYVNGKTGNRAAVQFSLSGTKHSFKFGSTYGRGWICF